MNQHRCGEKTQQNSTTQCGPWAAAGQNLPLMQRQKNKQNITDNKAFAAVWTK